MILPDYAQFLKDKARETKEEEITLRFATIATTFIFSIWLISMFVTAFSIK